MSYLDNYEILPMGGPFDDTPCKNVTIENNEVYNYPRAVGSHTYVKEIYQDNIVIKNNIPIIKNSMRV